MLSRAFDLVKNQEEQDTGWHLAYSILVLINVEVADETVANEWGAFMHSANRLLEEQWQLESEGEFSNPGTKDTPDAELPFVRLYPPDSNDWFVELLTVPGSEDEHGRQFTRIEVPSPDDAQQIWHFGLPSFQFLALTQWKPIQSAFGIHYARPNMMALANLLEHPQSERPP